MEIRVEGLTFMYPSGITALKGVSLTIHSGEAVAIIGQNGAGKTTLAKHLNGLLQPTSGCVSVGGWDTREHPVAHFAARVGYIFQNPDDQLFKPSVWAEVTFGPKNLGWQVEKIEQHAREALQIVGLSEAAGRHPYDLSFSQRKNVALASVLAMDTPVIVFDEPTTGQDYAGTEKVGGIITQLKKQGKTIVTITHDIDFCAEHFERTIVMADGGILLDGPSRQVLAQAGILAQTYVEPPQMIRLASRLGMPAAPLTVAEFIEQWSDNVKLPKSFS
ncbi:MAG: energy-coupling factor ABC transporter ATP-binding protein [Omnitrophica WOR_2 bacterium]